MQYLKFKSIHDGGYFDLYDKRTRTIKRYSYLFRKLRSKFL